MGHSLSSTSRSPPKELRTGGPLEPAPQHQFISEKKKGPLDGPSMTYTTGEQLKHQELSGSTSLPETSSELSHPGLSRITNFPVLRKRSAYTAGNKHSEQSIRRIRAARKYAAMLSKNCDEFTSSFPMDSSVSEESSTIASDYLLDQPLPGTLTEAGIRIKHAASAASVIGSRYLTFDPFEPDLDFELSVLSKKESVSSSSTVCSDKIKIIPASDVFGTSNIHFSRTTSLSPTTSAKNKTFTGVSSSPYMLNSLTQYACTIRSITNTQLARSCSQIFSSDPHRSRRDSSCLSRSHSMPSLIQITSAETCTRAGCLTDMMLESSPEEFTPDITADEHDETYKLQCSGSGLYQCSVTGLVFHMEGEGVVVYRTVPWNRRLLAQYHKRPAGPLFDIKCVQQSMCRLHLPHCEIRSTGGSDLSVAHVTDEGIEFISPHQITETHVVINITEFSGFGNVTDEDSPADPVRALVLLFYRPPADPHPTSLINVLLLPRNVVLRDVLRIRKKLVGDEIYIETSPHCKLQPRQEYTLSTRPEDDSVLVQPTEAEFDCDNYDNYFPSFQVKLKTILIDIKLLLRDINSFHCVWEREVCLSSTGGRRSTLNLPPRERLLDIRSSFVDSISEPVLKSLLDKLLEKKVIADSERETADVKSNKSDKARFVIDTVRKKGEAASSEMIEFLCEADPFLCEHLGLI